MNIKSKILSFVNTEEMLCFNKLNNLNFLYSKIMDFEKCSALLRSGKDEDKHACIGILERLCISENSTIPEKKEALIRLLEISPQRGEDILLRWRDGMSFVKENILKSLVSLLFTIISDNRIPEIHRLGVCTHIYNKGFPVELYCKFFNELLSDTNLSNNYKIDACKYLLLSGVQRYVEIATNIIFSVISDPKIPSKTRYEYISMFNSKTGISTLLNMAKILTPIDKKFLQQLQEKFFDDQNNDLFYRVLSAQSLLGLITEKDKISLFLLEVARNDKLEEGIRANAADIVIRMGSKQYTRDAVLIISELGSKDKKNPTIYENKQNVHSKDISDSVISFIESLFDEIKIGDTTSDHVIQKIRNLLPTSNLTREEKSRVRESLNRINIDDAVFTRYNLRISDILVYLWIKIHNEQKQDLEFRLLQELSDVPDGEGCSSGYISKIVNVIPGAIKISWEEQIYSNMTGRISHRMRNINIKDDVEYEKIIDDNLSEIFKELHSEFVDEGHTSEREFSEIFSKYSVIIKESYL